MTVCIKLAQDVTKTAPGMSSPLHLRAGDLQYIRGWIGHYCDPFGNDGDPVNYWLLHGGPDAVLSPVFHNLDVAEVYIWPDRCDDCRNLPTPCPVCQARFEAQQAQFADAPWPIWSIPAHGAALALAHKVAYRHGPFVFLYEIGRRVAACELATVLGLNGPPSLPLDKWVDDYTLYYRQYAPGGDLQPVSQLRFLLG